MLNEDLLIRLIPALAIAFMVIGFYKTLFERKVQAKERAEELLSKKTDASLKSSLTGSKGNGENLLKKRKKTKDKDGQGNEPTPIDKLELTLEQANILLTANEFLFISAASSFLGGILGWLATGKNLPLGILMGLCSTGLPYGFVFLKRMLRMKKAAAQFADILDGMVNAFRTGFGFSRAIQMVNDNYDDPWGTEFGKMSAEMNLGANLDDALANLSRRMPSPDVDLFVTAILIQKETGGSMAELLGTLSKTIRDRYKLFQKVGAISAQGKLSAGIVCCIPFVLCGIMFLFLPEAMGKFFTNPIGIVLAILAGFWMLCGVGVLYKIVQIDV
ncbi:MAG: type II secretion system F family protein [Cyanobacteria bacterium P01_H01_bin.74]